MREAGRQLVRTAAAILGLFVLAGTAHGGSVAMSNADTPDDVYKKVGCSALGLDAATGELVYRDWVFIIKTWEEKGKKNCVAEEDKYVFDCRYLYADSVNPSFRVIGSVEERSGILDERRPNPVAAVIELIQRQGNGHVMWNDQGSCGTHESHGKPKACKGLGGGRYPNASSAGNGWKTAHSKGYLGICSGGGVYVNHSNPHFPVIDKKGPMTVGSESEHSGLSSNLSQHFLMISLDTASLDGFARLLQTIAPAIQAMKEPASLDGATYPLLSAFFDGADKSARVRRATGSQAWSTDIFGKAGKGSTMKSQALEQDASLAWSTGDPEEPPAVAAVARYDYTSNGPLPTRFSTWAKTPMYQFDWTEHVLAPELQCDLLVYSFHSGQSPNFLAGDKPPSKEGDMPQYRSAFVPYAAGFHPYGYDAERGFKYSVRNIGGAYWQAGAPSGGGMPGPLGAVSCPGARGEEPVYPWSTNHMKVGICQAFNDALTSPVGDQGPLNQTGEFQPYVLAGGWNRAGGQWLRGSLFTGFVSRPLWESLWCMFSFRGEKQWDAGCTFSKNCLVD